MKSIFRPLKTEPVLSIATLLAILSMFFVTPSKEYLGYIDFRTLELLLCFMLVVAGFQDIGVFSYVGMSLLSKTKNTRQLASILIFLCFFTSMLITNDVALLTFVPFSIMLLRMLKREDLFIPVLVLQTIAANLGSMLTPIGNPQNLYLYSLYEIPMRTFILTMLPLTIVAFFLLILFLFHIRKETYTLEELVLPQKPKTSFLLLYTGAFLLCLSSVLHLLSSHAMLLLIVLFVCIVNRSLFAKADYKLLLTFVAFFIFIGNMERIPMISETLCKLINQRELILGTLLSQVISNVPAAILLSGFTKDVTPLLYGVNVGGLGTLIASLASVISYGFYSKTENAKKGAYIKTFTLYNLLFLVILFVVAMVLYYKLKLRT